MQLFNKDTVITIIIRFLVMLSGIVTSIITARTLGPNGRGEFSWLSSLALTIATFSYLGLPSSNTYLIVKQKISVAQIFINSFWISILAGVFGVIIYSLLKQDFIHSVYFLIQIPAIMLTCFAGNILLGIGQIRKYNYVDGSTSLIVIILYILCWYFKQGLWAFLIANLFGVAFSSLLGVYFLYDKITITSWFYFDKAIFKNGIGFAMKVYLTVLIGFAIGTGNIFLIDFFHNKQEIGFFSIAFQVYTSLTTFSVAIGYLLFPHLINSQDKWNTTKKIMKKIALLMALISIIVYLTIKPILLFVFSSKFIDSLPIIYSIIPASFFLSLCTILSQYLASIGYPREQVFVWIIVFIFWVISALIFIPSMKGFGAGLTLSITNAITFILLYIVALQKAKIVYEK